MARATRRRKNEKDEEETREKEVKPQTENNRKAPATKKKQGASRGRAKLEDEKQHAQKEAPTNPEQKAGDVDDGELKRMEILKALENKKLTATQKKNLKKKLRKYAKKAERWVCSESCCRQTEIYLGRRKRRRRMITTWCILNAGNS